MYRAGEFCGNQQSSDFVQLWLLVNKTTQKNRTKSWFPSDCIDVYKQTDPLPLNRTNACDLTAWERLRCALNTSDWKIIGTL